MTPDVAVWVETVRGRKEQILDAAARPEGISWATIERWEAEHDAALDSLVAYIQTLQKELPVIDA